MRSQAAQRGRDELSTVDRRLSTLYKESIFRNEAKILLKIKGGSRNEAKRTQEMAFDFVYLMVAKGDKRTQGNPEGVYPLENTRVKRIKSRCTTSAQMSSGFAQEE